MCNSGYKWKLGRGEGARGRASYAEDSAHHTLTVQSHAIYFIPVVISSVLQQACSLLISKGACQSGVKDKRGITIVRMSELVG